MKQSSRVEHSFEATFREKSCTFFAVNDTHISVHRLLWEVWHPASPFRPYFDLAMNFARLFNNPAKSFHTERHQTIDRFLLVPVDGLVALLERASEGSPYAKQALALHDIPGLIETLRKQWAAIKTEALQG